MAAKTAVRAVLNPGNKNYGKLTDRFFFGNEVATLDFSVLSLLDSKRDFRFLERKMIPTNYHAIVNDTTMAGAFATSLTFIEKTLFGYEQPINEAFHYPYFFSASQACNRSAVGGSSVEHGEIFGCWKGPGPVFIVDNQGNAGDFLAPGTKLVVSRTGMVHKYVDQGAFGVLKYATENLSARDAWRLGSYVSNLPVIVGWSPCSATFGNPYYEYGTPNCRMGVPTTEGALGIWANLKVGGFVHQDATHIYFVQIGGGTDSGTKYNWSAAGPPSKAEIIALKKSDGTTIDITLTAAFTTTCMTGITHKSLTTTEGTPQKALLSIHTIGNSAAKTIYLNKIIGTAATNVGIATNYTNYFYGETIPTQLMENLNASFSTHWKMYFPMAGFNTYTAQENTLTLQLYRFNKTLLTAGTLTPCTLSGIPLEYCSANGDGTKLRCANTSKLYSNSRYDAVFAAEVYDGADQYVAYWIGRTKSPVWTTDMDAYSFNEVTDQSYRWFLLFKVNATDDSILTYQSCVPEFKNAKPMYCYVASADNKFMAMANQDGLFCFVWSSATKSFICTDQLALPGIFSLGMDETQSGGRGTVFVEVLATPSNPDDSLSHIYQVDFGDYEDVDIRYYNGSAYITDFGYNALNLTVDGNNNFTQQTITAEVRVKNKVGEAETTFVTGKTVRLKISGVRETDGCYFVNADSGNPYQKTITTTGAWLSFQFYLQKPLTGGMKITGEIV